MGIHISIQNEFSDLSVTQTHSSFILTLATDDVKKSSKTKAITS